MPLDLDVLRLNVRIEGLIRPSILFSSIEEVRQFVKLGSIEDLNCFIQACIEDEAFSYIQIIKDELQKR